MGEAFKKYAEEYVNEYLKDYVKEFIIENNAITVQNLMKNTGWTLE